MDEESSFEERNSTEQKQELGRGTILFHMESEVERKIKEELKSAADADPRAAKTRFELQASNEPMPRPGHHQFSDIAGTYMPVDVAAIKRQVVGHVEHTLGRALDGVRKEEMYMGVVLSVRDRLLECLNDSKKSCEKKKVLYCVTKENIECVSLRKTLLNLGLESQYFDALKEMGYELEDMYAQDVCADDKRNHVIEELTTFNCPVRYYGLMYSHSKLPATLPVPQTPPWLIKNSDSPILIKFGGKTVKVQDKLEWKAEETIGAISYSAAISGYNTFHTNMIKKFKACSLSSAKHTFKPKKLTKKQYRSSGDTEEKEYKLRQDYLLAAATVAEIVGSHGMGELLDEVGVHLADPSGALVMVELFRVLFDEHSIKYEQAFEIIKKIFTYKYTGSEDSYYEVPILERILPRHLEIIYLLNHNFLELVKSKYSHDAMRRLSWIEESEPKRVRLENICYTLARLFLTHLCKDNPLLRDFEPYFNYKEKTVEFSLGEPHRKWIVEVNAELANILTRYIGDDKWKKDFAALRGFEAFTNDEALAKDWTAMKLHNKQKLATFLMSKMNVMIPSGAMLNVVLCSFSPGERVIMAGFYLLHQYSIFKTERKEVAPRVVVFGSISPVQSEAEKDTLNFLRQLADLINSDVEMKEMLTVLVIADCDSKFLEKIIPAADLSEFLTPANSWFMNFIMVRCAMNGCLILGANSLPVLQLAQEVGKGNLFRFEPEENDKGQALDAAMRELGKVDKGEKVRALVGRSMEDFGSYAATHIQAEECYAKQGDWIAKAVLAVARCGKFSLDKTIRELANDVW